jgi:hypothetical protein
MVLPPVAYFVFERLDQLDVFFRQIVQSAFKNDLVDLLG